MPINIPSTTSTTLGTVEIAGEATTVHYQQFVMTSPSGISLGTEEFPIPVKFVDQGAFTQSFNQSKSLFPSAAAYYSEPLNNSGYELANEELSVLRSTVRGSLKTAGDGRVNELISTIFDGYDDIYVVEGSFDSTALNTIDPYGGFFDSSRTPNRYMYVPMIRSGWRNLSFSFKSAAPGLVTIFADFGSITADLEIFSKQVISNVRYAFTPESIAATGIVYSVPMLGSAVNGFIIAFIPDYAVAGTFEVHLVRGT